MKKKLMGLMLFAMMSVACLAQGGSKHGARMVPNSKTYVARLEKFVTEVDANDTLSQSKKAEYSETYKKFLSEYKVVNDSLSDEDVRKCSKAKVQYQKAMARIFAVNTADDVSDRAQDVGKKVSKFFRKTGKKIQGAIDGFKDN